MDLAIQRLAIAIFAKAVDLAFCDQRPCPMLQFAIILNGGIILIIDVDISADPVGQRIP